MNETAAEAGTGARPGDTFHVRATPGGGWWGITIDELGSVFAQTDALRTWRRRLVPP